MGRGLLGKSMWMYRKYKNKKSNGEMVKDCLELQRGQVVIRRNKKDKGNTWERMGGYKKMVSARYRCTQELDVTDSRCTMGGPSGNTGMIVK